MKIVADHGPGLGCVHGAFVSVGLVLAVAGMVRIATGPFVAGGVMSLLMFVPIAALAGAFVGTIGAGLDNVTLAAVVGGLLLMMPFPVVSMWNAAADTDQPSRIDFTVLAIAAVCGMIICAAGATAGVSYRKSNPAKCRVTLRRILLLMTLAAVLLGAVKALMDTWELLHE